MADFDTDTLEANGWRQGSVCDAKTLHEHCGAKLPKQAIAVLVSHDCDIFHRNPTNEPIVEWLVAVEVASTQKDCLYGKNPRRLHFQHDGKYYESWAHDRITTPRELLLKFSTAQFPKLAPRPMDQIANWLAKRYIRPAFPDEFNKRLSANKSEIQESIAEGHELLRQILIRVDPMDKELPSEETYQVSLFGVMFDDDYNDATKREKCVALISNVEALLGGCKGIIVNDCLLKSDEDISVAEVDVLSEWDFDYLTGATAGPD